MWRRVLTGWAVTNFKSSPKLNTGQQQEKQLASSVEHLLQFAQLFAGHVVDLGILGARHLPLQGANEILCLLQHSGCLGLLPDMWDQQAKQLSVCQTLYSGPLVLIQLRNGGMLAVMAELAQSALLALAALQNVHTGTMAHLRMAPTSPTQ